MLAVLVWVAMIIQQAGKGFRWKQYNMCEVFSLLSIY